jgi:ketosteroid isomerase-like protein
MRRHSPLLTLFCVSQLAVTAAAQQGQDVAPAPASGAEDPAHAELRQLREALTEAVLAGDVDAQLALTDENIVTTWQNSRVARGHDGLREFLNDMTAGGDDVFQGYTVRPTADDLSILHGGNTAIAYGSSVPHYRYLGMEFDLENRWTATLVNSDGQWKVAAYHVSANVADNPILDAARRSLWMAGGIGAAIGIIVGLIGGMSLQRRRQPRVGPAGNEA